MPSNRQQQVNSFLEGITQKELDNYISKNKLNVKYADTLRKIRDETSSKTHIDMVFKDINTKFNKEYVDYIWSVYKIGQAQLIALFLNNFYDENYKISNIKKLLKAWMDNDKELKNYVYEIMKDY